MNNNNNNNSKHFIPDILPNIVNISLDDPRFFSILYTAVVKERKAIQSKDADNLKRVISEEYDDLSRRLDQTNTQDSCSVRNVLRTRRLANLLVNDKGEINTTILPRVINHVTAHLYSLGPRRQYDGIRQERILKVLKWLRDNKDLVLHLKRINAPYSNPNAEGIIRETLQLAPATPIKDAHARRAALAALMCYLRQNVGSCFATAPAIIVHDEQPDVFLSDIVELLGTGRLKRTFGGVEYSAPLSPSWGAGDLRKPLLFVWGGTQKLSDPWYAPGLMYALEVIELIPKEVSAIEKLEYAKELVLTAFPEWGESQPILITSMEEIFRRILMRRLHITQEDLTAYDQRPKGMIHAGLFMQMSPSGSGMGGKGEACGTFYFQLDQVSNVFKSMASNALLKAWEYTMASFSETKSEFTSWNLYFSLGLKPDEPGGIGEALFKFLQQKVDYYNRKVEEIQSEYEQLFALVKTLESRMRHGGGDQDQWTRVEYQTKTNEFYAIEEVRNNAHARAGLFASLYDVLISKYDSLFPQYFQEIYDPDLLEVKVGPYDDSPAGFRLLYKHGRGSTALWTKIKNPSEFVDALVKFFTATENEIASMEKMDAIRNDITDIVTTIITHIKSEDFLVTAFNRMARAHNTAPIRDPLHNLEKITMKPWAYISGGTMNTLLSCYYCREMPPTEVARWVENPMELLVFFIDTIKHTPHNIMEPYAKDPNKSMLIHSPTHAFLLKPGISPFKESWQTEEYTYTWVRDTLVGPKDRFVESLYLDEEMMEYLIEKLLDKVPLNYQPYFKKVFARMRGRMHPRDFRETLLDKIDHERGLQYAGEGVLTSEDIDSTLYPLLPLFPYHEFSDRLKAIWNKLPGLSKEMHEQLIEIIDNWPSGTMRKRIVSSETLQDVCNALLCLVHKTTSLNVDLQKEVTKVMQDLGYAMPEPILFADTNWPKELFGFVVNPCTSVLDLWRMDPHGKLGAPMTIWREWMNGSRKDRTWGIYNKPQEYSGFIKKLGPFQR